MLYTFDEILTLKTIILGAETWNLPTRKLQQVNAYETRNSFKKDIRLHFNCEIYFLVHVFLHLQTGEMPSCGISSGYALFVKVKKDLKAKYIIFSSRRKKIDSIYCRQLLLNTVQSKSPLTDKS